MTITGKALLNPPQSKVRHKFSIGDQVVYTNPFGVCWGVKTITALDERSGRPTYHYEGSDTPWFSVGEENFKPASAADMAAHHAGDDTYFQETHGFTPTIEQLGGCY